MHGHICENEAMFFFANLTDKDVDAHARFLVSAEGAEAGAATLALLPRDGIAPQRLSPPFTIIDGSTGELESEATLCAAERGGHGGHGGGDGLIWLGVFAGPSMPCVGLAISLELFEDGVGDYGSHSCHRMPVIETSGIFSQSSSSEVLPLNTARLGSCQPNEWVDYEVPLSAADLANNLLFEVMDTSGRNDPEALSIHIFANERPDDRATEHRSERAQSSGVYSVYKSTVGVSLADDNADLYYLAVHCGSAASVTFTALVVPVIAPLPTLAHWLHGEACPGSWTYHHLVPAEHFVGASGHADDGGDDGTESSSYSSYYSDTDDGAFANVSLTLRVTVSLLLGELTMVGRDGHAPVKVAPPFAILDSTGSNSTIVLCDVDPYKTYYVGIGSNGATCAAYEIRAEVSEAQPGDEARCAAERRALDSAGAASTVGATDLPFDTLVRGSVASGVYADYRIG